MATLLPDKVPPPHPFDTIAFDIENRYERIVNIVRERKRTLLTQLTEFREEYDTLLSNKNKTEQELKNTKEYIEKIKENDLKKMQENFLLEIEANIRKLTTSNYFVQFECESKALENKLSRLGELIKLDYKLPNYSKMVTPVVAVGKRGKGKDTFSCPSGIAFEEETQLNYVCDNRNSRVKTVSMAGEFSEFGSNELVEPWGILLHKDSIYVTDIDQCAIFQFNLSNHKLMRKLGKNGSEKSEFNTPKSLAIGPDGHLYVAENNNNRISVIDVILNFKRFIQHKTILSPQDVLFTDNNMLILSYDSPHRVHLLTLQGTYLKSLISIEQYSWTPFFCLDRANNILVSISNKNLVQVYNEEGKLLHTIGEGQLGRPYGLTTTRSGRVILVSSHRDHGFQIF